MVSVLSIWTICPILAVAIIIITRLAVMVVIVALAVVMVSIVVLLMLTILLCSILWARFVLTAVFNLYGFVAGCILVLCFLVFNKTLSGRNYLNVKIN